MLKIPAGTTHIVATPAVPSGRWGYIAPTLYRVSPLKGGGHRLIVERRLCGTFLHRGTRMISGFRSLAKAMAFAKENAPEGALIMPGARHNMRVAFV